VCTEPECEALERVGGLPYLFGLKPKLLLGVRAEFVCQDLVCTVCHSFAPTWLPRSYSASMSVSWSLPRTDNFCWKSSERGMPPSSSGSRLSFHPCLDQIRESSAKSTLNRLTASEPVTILVKAEGQLVATSSSAGAMALVRSSPV
jgi:hypothetical protein